MDSLEVAYVDQLRCRNCKGFMFELFEKEKGKLIVTCLDCHKSILVWVAYVEDNV